MKAEFEFDRKRFTVTSEHSASNYGQPVLLVDGQLTDVGVVYAKDEVLLPSALELLAKAAGVWPGPATLAALDKLAEEMLADVPEPQGADYDKVVAEFLRRGKVLRGEEVAE